MKTLDALESRAIHVLREAYANFRQLCMLWSIGKDSTVMLWLARKAFFGHVPFPLVHVDTSFKIPEMLAWRDRVAAEWGLTLLAGENREALDARRTFPSGAVDRLTCCRLLKTDALTRTLSGEGPRRRFDVATRDWKEDVSREAFTGVIVGARADEEGSRSKERVFSARDERNTWDVAEQPPELWRQFKTEFAPGTHVRIHPLLEWTELNVWEYIAREGIPTVSLYYDQGRGQRYRSLGCAPCTAPIASTAKSPADIVVELREGALKGIAERSGRAQDVEDGGGLETLRRGGYM
ncbi:MAG: sulfate adenylyltransferase subunit CysD [Myxococcota bacterium]